MLRPLSLAAMLVAGLGLLAATWPGAADIPCGEAPDILDDWDVATPASVGFDPAALCAIGARLADPNAPNLHSLLVIRHGRLVYETYAEGRDERWGRDIGVIAYDARRLHDMRSVTKSVVSLLFGIAFERNAIKDLDAPAIGFFPEYADLATPDINRITLKHLLTMTPGLAWSEGGPWFGPTNDERLMYEATDPYRYVFTRRPIYAPGTRWEYSSGATTLLGAVLQKAIGRQLPDFAREALFEPLGMREVEWITLGNGDAAAGGGLRLKPRDMAKIGQLVLAGGIWQGRRVVSEEWIRQSIEPRFEGWLPMRYGYQWWVGGSKVGDRSVPWIAAIGLGGQRLFIVPSLDLVVASTAGLYREADQGYYARAILEDDVIPAIRDAGAR
ncbi:serine hydrolase [Bosea sp. 117]|uniref:serine hydrolase domain-containing protein n=1 Tax=Bosea sp. 117 TaxID=1125973 RepID=UPI0018CC132E|nr:serine hydrolase [Bosea sp. 117]